MDIALTTLTVGVCLSTWYLIHMIGNKYQHRKIVKFARLKYEYFSIVLDSDEKLAHTFAQVVEEAQILSLNPRLQEAAEEHLSSYSDREREILDETNDRLRQIESQIEELGLTHLLDEFIVSQADRSRCMKLVLARHKFD